MDLILYIFLFIFTFFLGLILLVISIGLSHKKDPISFNKESILFLYSTIIVIISTFTLFLSLSAFINWQFSNIIGYEFSYSIQRNYEDKFDLKTIKDPLFQEDSRFTDKIVIDGKTYEYNSSEKNESLIWSIVISLFGILLLGSHKIFKHFLNKTIDNLVDSSLKNSKTMFLNFSEYFSLFFYSLIGIFAIISGLYTITQYLISPARYYEEFSYQPVGNQLSIMILAVALWGYYLIKLLRKN